MLVIHVFFLSAPLPRVGQTLIFFPIQLRRTCVLQKLYIYLGTMSTRLLSPHRSLKQRVIAAVNTTFNLTSTEVNTWHIDNPIHIADSPYSHQLVHAFSSLSKCVVPVPAHVVAQSDTLFTHRAFCMFRMLKFLQFFFKCNASKLRDFLQSSILIDATTKYKS